MNSILVTMFISLLLLKPNGGGQKPVEDYSSVQYKGREYKVEEWGMPPGSQIKPVQGFYINGYHIIPKEIKHRGAVLVFGGADETDLWSAMIIAYHGYEVYAMHIFRGGRQKTNEEQAPLEFFAELYLYIQQTAQSPKPLTIYGSSLGAELGLLLASIFPEQVDQLILYAPSAYVFQSFYSNPPCSPWAFQGKELPFISTDGSEEMKTKHLIAVRDNKPVSTGEFYRYGLEHDKNREKARINLALVRAKMLLFAGELDEVWPAVDMAREIKANYDGECELVIFEKAGHWFSKRNMDGMWKKGGEPEANERAFDESYRIKFEKLEEWTK